jgi:hypothetical protein
MAILTLLELAACATALTDPTPLVNDARVLAVSLDPAEAAAGDPVSLTALYADASGQLDAATVDWSFCLARKPLAELGPVAESCLDPASADLGAMGTGLQVEGTIPEDACSVFGPNPPTSTDGSSGARPVDPDVTGGYYQPLVGFPEDGDVTLAAERVRCGLANVTQETYAAWNASYHSNTSPEVASVTADAGDGPAELTADGEGDPPAIAAGQRVTLTTTWPECAGIGGGDAACGDGVCAADEDAVGCPADCEAPVGCGGAETYTLYDPATGTLGTRREAIEATWFATAGTFADARVGRFGDDETPTVADVWQAPDTAGEVWLAVVLRDERGGVAFRSYRVGVGR